MYYHRIELKYVRYDKIYPPSETLLKSKEPEMLRCYRWLSHYCNFFPQMWLSRSHFTITGFKNSYNEDPILFGFEYIKGFPVDYNVWEYIMCSLMNNEKFEDQNKEIIKFNNELVDDYKKDGEEPDGEVKMWVDCGKDLDLFLKKHLFVEKDQVVLPSLNLKCAKMIICRNEKQKKALRKMGFIDDRIKIKNIKFNR